MATESQAAHLRQEEARHGGAHFGPDSAERDPRLAAEREAQRNLRGVAAICLMLVAAALLLSASLSPLGGSADDAQSLPAHVGAPLGRTVGRMLGELAKEEEALERQAAWLANPENILTGANAELETVTSPAGVTATAPVGFSQTSPSAALDQAVADFEDKGYVLGFMLVDVDTGRTLAYNADEPRYPASSIKAAFCTYVFETNGLVSEGLVKPCIIDSSNEAYHALIRAHGQQGFSEWLAPMAPDAAGNAAVHFYPWISPREFMAVWQEIYRFGSSDEPGAAELTDYLGQTTTSAWGDLLRDEWVVWAKAGWYPTTVERATNDCGIVFSDCGPYIAVVMSDAPEDFEALAPVLDALNAAHGKMCGGSIESRL